MKISRTIHRSLFITFLLCLSVYSQTQSKDATRFSKNGLVFDYPADMKLQDLSTEYGQHLVLNEDGGGQIMIISRYDKITTPEQLVAARKDVAGVFTENISKELLKLDPKLTRADAEIEVAGARATGVRLGAVLGDGPGSAEIYSLQLGHRLVIVTLIGSGKQIAAAANAWSTVRGSLKVEEVAAAAPK
jgi:hypothetical protein